MHDSLRECSGISLCNQKGRLFSEISIITKFNRREERCLAERLRPSGPGRVVLMGFGSKSNWKCGNFSAVLYAWEIRARGEQKCSQQGVLPDWAGCMTTGAVVNFNGRTRMSLIFLHSSRIPTPPEKSVFLCYLSPSPFRLHVPLSFHISTLLNLLSQIVYHQYCLLDYRVLV